MEWPDGVLAAPKIANPGQHQQHGGCAQQADPEVGGGLVCHGAGGAQSGHDGVGRRDADHGQRHAEDGGQPQALNGLVGRPTVLAGTGQAGYGGGGAVGQEDAEAVAEQQGSGCHT